MAYIDAGADPAARAKAAVTVIGIHALLGFGLVAGLAVTGSLPTIDRGFEGLIFETDPPEIPDETETIPDDTAPPYSPPQAPDAHFALDTPTVVDFAPVTDRPRDVALIPGPIPGPTASPGPIATPSPPPSAFTPIGPRPSNNVQRWITSDDYSRSDLMREREGTARYRLVIGSNGSIDACEITASTGHSSLDRTTCRLLERRARFDAATDRTGAKVVGTYTGSVTWQIPE